MMTLKKTFGTPVPHWSNTSGEAPVGEGLQILLLDLALMVAKGRPK